MSTPTADAKAGEKSLSVQSDLDSDVSNLVAQENPNSSIQIEQRPKQKIDIDAERIRSSIARLTSNSIGELEGLASELHKLDEFVKSETGRVQREVESVLAGIKIIIDAIAPWKQPSLGSPGITRATATGASNRR
jgi:hypothetical protein